MLRPVNPDALFTSAIVPNNPFPLVTVLDVAEDGRTCGTDWFES